MTPPPATCAIAPAYSEPIDADSALPADALSQAISAFAIVERDAAATPSVHGAAHCWRVELERTVPPVGQKILLTYVCGNKFRLRNTNTALVRVAVDVYGTTERHSYFVAPGIDQFVKLLKRGTTRVFFNGQLVQAKANGNKAC
jgi:hypothetical protein